MLTKNFLRSYIRIILKEQLFLEFDMMPSARVSYPTNIIPFDVDDNIAFGQWSGFKVFPGEPGFLVFKLNKDPNNKLLSYDSAKSMGAEFLPNDYLMPGHPFYEALKKNSSDSSLRRNIAIAKAKNDKEIDQTIPFNGSRSFYVKIRNTNENLINKDTADFNKKFNEETFLGLLINNPAKGYGKLIKRLPPLERAHFISFLTKAAAIPSAVSGAAGLSGWAFNVPGLKQASGVISAMSVGPFLGLSSIAAEENDPSTAAMYLFAAAVTPWGAYHEITGAFVAAINTAKSAGLAKPGMQLLFESVGGSGKITLIDKFIDFLKIIWQRFAAETNIGWIAKGENLWAKNFAGKEIVFTTIEKEFIQTMLKNKAIIEFADQLSNIWLTIKSAIVTAFSVAGITFDIIDITKPAELVETGEVKKENLTKEKLDQYVNTAKSSLRQEIMKFSSKSKTSDFYNSIRKTGKTIVINKDNLSQQKEASPVKISTLNNVVPDILFLPSSDYDVYETLINFPESFFNSRRNVFVQDPGANAVFMFKIDDIVN
jgi:hypothetical protein